MNTLEIKLKIHEEADLFSSFDPERRMLSEDVVGYLERNYLNKHRVPAEQYIIHIYSDTPLNEEDVAARFAEYFSQMNDNVVYERRKLLLKQIGLIGFGVLILLFWFYLSSRAELATVVQLEILSIMGWVAIWEATSIALLQLPELLRRKKAYEKTFKARIIIDVITDGQSLPQSREQ